MLIALLESVCPTARYLQTVSRNPPNIPARVEAYSRRICAGHQPVRWRSRSAGRFQAIFARICCSAPGSTSCASQRRGCDAKQFARRCSVRPSTQPPANSACRHLTLASHGQLCTHTHGEPRQQEKTGRTPGSRCSCSCCSYAYDTRSPAVQRTKYVWSGQH